MPDVPDIPQWLYGLAVAAGIAISVVLARLGFNKGASGQAIPEKLAPVAAVVVDMESLHKLTAAIEGHALALLEGKKAVTTVGETVERVSEQTAEELRNLQREVRELAREVARKR